MNLNQVSAVHITIQTSSAPMPTTPNYATIIRALFSSKSNHQRMPMVNRSRKTIAKKMGLL